jgi:phosphohistidine phosphatase
MKLCLVRHGAATPMEENPGQPLTEKGRRDIQRLAVFLARSGVSVARVIHSGKKRAEETAVLLADVVGPGKVVEEAEAGLGPNDSTDLLATAAAALIEDAMVVGHQPFMGRMVARLLAGTEDAIGVAFEPGTVVCLERSDNGGGWHLNWMAGPRLLGQ